jgi:acyl-CoA synthetase (AMP-forming)/AMP-acid ligase II
MEADGRVLRRTPAPELAARVGKEVWEAHRLDVDEVLVLPRGALPKTSSGKVQRRACRDRYREGDLVPVNIR